MAGFGCPPRARGEWVQKKDSWYVRGLYFDSATWDGSDVFMAAGKGFKFVTRPVYECLERLSVKNVTCVPLSDEMTSEIVLRHTPGVNLPPR